MIRFEWFARGARASAWLLAGICAIASLAAAAGNVAADAETLTEQGRRIYMDGVLPSGKPLEGVRLDDQVVSGPGAACIACHRRSGMGGVEGDLQIPPITGRFLYAKRTDMALAIMDPRFGRMMNHAHVPYGDESLATAIRAGVNSAGHSMNPAMPRYALGDGDTRALIAYLQQLSGQWSPGANADTVRFATVIAPGVEPARRQLLLDMLHNSLAQKNGSTITGAQRGGRRHMATGAEQILGTERKWELDVWELQGPADTWAEQLEANYRRKPVFALLSGISNGAWEPVHDFCERRRVPCWFPSVDLPPKQQSGVYSMYFSRGVALEAEVLARHLLADRQSAPGRVVQIYRDGGIGRQAAVVLKNALAGSGIVIEERPVRDGGPEALGAVLAAIQEGDCVVFWLHSADLSALEAIAPLSVPMYFSAEMGSAERGPLPTAWRRAAHMIYPYELPEAREQNLTYFRSWLKTRRLPLTDETLQSEIYFAVTFLTDTVAEMLDNLNRDYLLERAEDMLGRRETGRAEGEVRDRGSLGTPEQLARRYPHGRKLDDDGLTLQPGQGPNLLAMRRGTTVYPRLTLGPGQRFASKGGYVVRFEGDDGSRLVADSGWIVP